MKFVVGYRSADGISLRFGQQVNKQSVPGIEGFSFFQSRQAILQHVLNIKRPERGGDEHPLIKSLQRSNRGRVQLCDGSMIMEERFPGPLRPVKSAGLEFFNVKIQGGCHVLPWWQAYPGI